ncbi:hypothetical protein CBR_g60689 [Chara braunii]|uniref:RNA-binding S4 domain-containing protein n=1 Tax=Chara braunii TaxID=69332 RepID=A0A388MFG0_CHABU|nr:hypothetical protein CBR_g60689 [Chara braunii]|eukprot:GBG93215.1 hypothetical protein CBR_g60689 [Chara braunii]
MNSSSVMMMRELGGVFSGSGSSLRVCNARVGPVIPIISGLAKKPQRVCTSIMAWAAVHVAATRRMVHVAVSRRMGGPQRSNLQLLSRAQRRCSISRHVATAAVISTIDIKEGGRAAGVSGPAAAGGGGGGGGGYLGDEMQAIRGLTKWQKLSGSRRSSAWPAVVVPETRRILRWGGGWMVLSRRRHVIAGFAPGSVPGIAEGKGEGEGGGGGGGVEGGRSCDNVVGGSWEEVLEKTGGEGPMDAMARKRAPRKRGRYRLDELCVERCPQYSRTIIQSWILQGKVLVDGRPATKAGMQVTDSANIEIIAQVPKYVCRAGLKLEAALLELGVDVQGKVVLDAGLSTGGFTDCLLKHGATRVYGVDVGYGQVAEKIRTDSRVEVMERTNLRYLEELPELVDLVTLDLSFISILKVMPAVCGLMKPDSELVVLIKPQFEARRDQVGGGGIVRSTKVHDEVLERVIAGITAYGFDCTGRMTSPIKGAEGNVEFLSHFKRVLQFKHVLQTSTSSPENISQLS